MEDVFEETAIDIDIKDAKNPLAAVDYVEDLYVYYSKMEVSLVDYALVLEFPSLRSHMVQIG